MSIEVISRPTERVFYRLITPSTFANLDFITLEMAQSGKVDFGSTPDNRYYQYWQDRMKECKIVKVTEITEEIVES